MHRPYLGCDLAALFPHIAVEWDYEQNNTEPNKYAPYSNKRVWWKCPVCGEKWQAKISNRTSNNNGCPYCTGKLPIAGVNDLATLYPNLTLEWSPQNVLTPADVLPNSNRLVQWICKHGHCWTAKVYHRTSGRSCPYCAGNKPIVGETDLLTQHPSIAAQWHQERNSDSPQDYTSHSHHVAWWVCAEGHEYSSPIYRRTRGSGCPVCAGKSVLPGYNDLQTLAPELAKEWDYERNGNVLPNEILLRCNTKSHWICSKCGHSWCASPNNRSRTACPACAHRCIVPANSLAVVQPSLAYEFDAERNAVATTDVAAWDNRKYWWQGECGHQWQASPANRMKGTGCPYCSGKLPIAGVNDLATLYPNLIKEWHTKNSTTPHEYLPNSHKNVWWLGSCGHEWQAPIYSRVNGSGCPKCRGRLSRTQYVI